MKRPARLRCLLALLGCVLLASGCEDEPPAAPAGTTLGSATSATQSVDPSDPNRSAPMTRPSFVGSQRCAECHPGQASRWMGSHHDLAMQVATQESILGDFDEASFAGYDEEWRFFRDGPRFVVERTGPGGEQGRHEVEYAFGIAPLQQYLVESDRGRLQALPVAWDTRPVDQGGQRWYSLQPQEAIPADDPLHWSGIAYNWNSQCAACHSTGLEKGYDVAADGFDSRWEEIDVGCEACHGPGSEHAAELVDSNPGQGSERPGLSVSFEAWDPSSWARAPEARIATRTRPRVRDAQLDVCAPCHSRRSQLLERLEVGAPFLDGHRLNLLEPGLYFDDGRIQDEVYVYGSFLQSRMAAAGVRCADCHDPHSLELRRPGNTLCTGCHSPEIFDVKAHHGHAESSPGSACVECHMPSNTYMGVDARRDHAFPLPRPLRSEAIGSPGVCAGCHSGESAVWAAEQIREWRRDAAPARPHWTDRLFIAAGAKQTEDASLAVERRSSPAAWLEIALSLDAPEIVRASAWMRYSMLAVEAPPLVVLRDAIDRAGPLERLGLIEVAARLEPGPRVALLKGLLGDPRRAVRIAAAAALLGVGPEFFRPADRATLGRVLVEYRAAQEVNGDRPEAQVNLGVLAFGTGDPVGARQAYLRAIERTGYFAPAYVNLADLERAEGNDLESVRRLREALELVPDDAMVRHALGLALHRSGQAEAASVELGEAARRAPGEPRFLLTYALSLDGIGHRAEAIQMLRAAVAEGRASGETRHALIGLLRAQGNVEEARIQAKAWLDAAPGDPRPRALLTEMNKAASAPVR